MHFNQLFNNAAKFFSAPHPDSEKKSTETWREQNERKTNIPPVMSINVFLRLFAIGDEKVCSGAAFSILYSSRKNKLEQEN